MSFSGDVNKFIKKAEARSLAIFRAVSLEMFSRIVVRTPVDTGRLRGHWQISPNIMLGKKTYISNNLPYAIPIEDGHSKQAPTGMVKVTVAEFGSIVRDAAK